jgi:hypothetical protein
MKRFNELSVQKTDSDKKQFDCERVKIAELLNTEIQVIDFESEVNTSHSDCACLVLVEHLGVNKKFFTTSPFLIASLKGIPEGDFPFLTTIKTVACGANKTSYKFT